MLGFAKWNMLLKAADVWNWDSPKKTVRCNYPGEQVSSGGGRRLSWMPLKVLLCDDLVGVVTSHVTKMAVTPFDPPWPKPRCCPQTSRLSFLRPKLLPIKVFHCVFSEFRQFIAKMVENIKYFIRTAELIKMIPKHIFWPIIHCFCMWLM